MTERLKYELTDYNEETELFRLRALMDFADVKAGDLGGWVRSSDSLSQYGDCWVYPEAAVLAAGKVRDNAKIWNKARVSGEACVKGNAIVRDNAWVTGGAVIRDFAIVADNAFVTGDAIICEKAMVLENERVGGKEIRGRGFGWCGT
jgi:UDP-3-O-[3-hydroxymyristoyl] glucosamine N-acyltransferase